MDTLYLVFKHQFQIVIWIALQTVQTRPKQTETVTYEVYSVKHVLIIPVLFFWRTKAPPFS